MSSIPPLQTIPGQVSNSLLWSNDYLKGTKNVPNGFKQVLPSVSDPATRMALLNLAQAVNFTNQSILALAKTNNGAYDFPELEREVIAKPILDIQG